MHLLRDHQSGQRRVSELAVKPIFHLSFFISHLPSLVVRHLILFLASKHAKRTLDVNGQRSRSDDQMENDLDEIVSTGSSCP